MAMNPEPKAELLAALRSGEYEKIIGRLAHPNPDGSVGYCCLGVATAAMAEKGLCEPLKLEDGFYRHYNGDLRSVLFLSENVAEHYGLNFRDQEVLVNLNDMNGTFNEVIEYIETNL